MPPGSVAGFYASTGLTVKDESGRRVEGQAGWQASRTDAERVDAGASGRRYDLRIRSADRSARQCSRVHRDASIERDGIGPRSDRPVAVRRPDRERTRGSRGGRSADHAGACIQRQARRKYTCRNAIRVAAVAARSADGLAVRRSHRARRQRRGIHGDGRVHRECIGTRTGGTVAVGRGDREAARRGGRRCAGDGTGRSIQRQSRWQRS